MPFQYLKHGLEELDKRCLPWSLLEDVLFAPEQKFPEMDNITGYPSHVKIDSQTYLLRVMVNETVNPPVVVRVYRTSTINTYWRNI